MEAGKNVDLIRACITTQNRQPNSNNNEIDLNNTPKKHSEKLRIKNELSQRNIIIIDTMKYIING